MNKASPGIKQRRRRAAVTGGRSFEALFASYEETPAPTEVPTTKSVTPLEKSPCDGCRFAPRCAAEQLACAAFSMFAHGLPALRWQAAPRAPSHAQFLSLEDGKTPQRAKAPLVRKYHDLYRWPR